MRTTHNGSRGVSLVEAMVALAVMSFGMLAVVGVQSTLRLNGDIAKQRSEATRIAQEKLDEWRSFTVIDAPPPGQTAWTGIADDINTVPGENATYEVQRQVITTVDPPAKVVRVTVRWADRAAANANDKNQSVMVASTIAAAAPGLSGTLAVRPGTAAVGPVRRPFKRHPTIPVLARDFGSSSAFVLPNRPRNVFVFNNVTGVVTGVCTLEHDTSNDTITPSDVQSCANTTQGQFLTGFVRFERSLSGPDLTAADVENPVGPAMNLRMRVDLTSSDHPQNPVCFDDITDAIAAAGIPFVTYSCVVFSNTSLLWSGISTIEALGGGRIDDSSDPEAHRVCRYTTATSDSQPVPNTEHPRNYSDVSGNLTNQNFVVIAGSKHCPTDVAANPAAGDLVNSNTLQHQPNPD